MHLLPIAYIYSVILRAVQTHIAYSKAAKTSLFIFATPCISFCVNQTQRVRFEFTYHHVPLSKLCIIILV